MENIIGIFHSIDSAERALQDLINRAIPEQAIVLLSRETPRSNETRKMPETVLDQARTTSAGSGGAGKAGGAALGATAGGSAGFAAGATAASLMVPGLGLIAAIGIGAAAILGLGGAAAGAKIGDSIDRSVDMGVSADQVKFCHQLLQHGYSLVIANVRSGAEISNVREVFRDHGSEDVETARAKLGTAA